jgi:hypothetical protein
MENVREELCEQTVLFPTAKIGNKPGSLARFYTG